MEATALEMLWLHSTGKDGVVGLERPVGCSKDPLVRVVLEEYTLEKAWLIFSVLKSQRSKELILGYRIIRRSITEKGELSGKI